MDELRYQRAPRTYFWAMPLINPRHEDWLEERLRRGLQHPADLEKATRRQDAGDHPSLQCPLRDELCGPGQGRTTGICSAADAARDSARGLAADHPCRWRKVRGRCRFTRSRRREGRKVSATSADYGYKEKVPEGYDVYRSGTNNVFIFLRAFYQDPKNLSPASRSWKNPASIRSMVKRLPSR